jgi:hypothetical protein
MTKRKIIDYQEKCEFCGDKLEHPVPRLCMDCYSKNAPKLVYSEDICAICGETKGSLLEIVAGYKLCFGCIGDKPIFEAGFEAGMRNARIDRDQGKMLLHTCAYCIGQMYGYYSAISPKIKPVNEV